MYGIVTDGVLCACCEHEMMCNICINMI